jgi:hypothetical protein
MLLAWPALTYSADVLADDSLQGFTSLFNSKDLSGWKVPEGDNGHWKVVDGVIDYDARSEGKGDKCLWSEKSYRDFILRIDWKLKKEPGFVHRIPVILPNGDTKKGPDGKSQVNIWTWPIGSGEVYGYRTDKKMPPEVRAGVTPKKNADRPRGEWNSFEITMKGDRLWVKLNGEEVITNAQLPGVAAEGPIALQHHGTFNPKTGKWTGPPSIVQFKNIWIKELGTLYDRK